MYEGAKGGKVGAKALWILRSSRTFLCCVPKREEKTARKKKMNENLSRAMKLWLFLPFAPATAGGNKKGL